MLYSEKYNRLIIDNRALEENYKKLREYIGGDFISVVKANAYGLGVDKVAKLLFSFGQNLFAVANLSEGVYLRRLLGDMPQIFIFGAVDIKDVAIVNKFKLIIPVYSNEFFYNIKSAKVKPKRIYLQVDTGMNRLGVKNDKNTVNGLIAYFSNENFEFYGIFSHFAEGLNLESNLKQIKAFSKTENVDISFSASDGALYDMGLKETKRIGLAMFGYGMLAEKLNLKSVASLKSRVIRLKSVKCGDRVGYNRYLIKSNYLVATIPLGYADGLKRSYVGENVFIKGKAYKIISVCMDMSMLLVDSCVRLNDEVVVFSEKYPIDRLAKADNTIVYECLTSLGDRICRLIK